MSDEPTGVSAHDVARQEAELHFGRFDHDDAWALGCALVERARTSQLPIAIDISRGDQQLFHAALPGSTPDNDDWIARKIATVRRFGVSSLAMSLKCRAEGRSLSELYGVDPAKFAAAGGCFPVYVEGAGIVGTVTVSGLPQVDDHRLVVETIRAYLAADRSATR